MWLHQQLCMQTHKYQPHWILAGQSHITKIVLSQASWQRATLLASASALQSQLSFFKSPLQMYKPSPRHLVFYFKFTYRLLGNSTVTRVTFLSCCDTEFNILFTIYFSATHLVCVARY